MKIHIKNGRLIDPAAGIDAQRRGETLDEIEFARLSDALAVAQPLTDPGARP